VRHEIQRHHGATPPEFYPVVRQPAKHTEQSTVVSAVRLCGHAFLFLTFSLAVMGWICHLLQGAGDADLHRSHQDAAKWFPWLRALGFLSAALFLSICMTCGCINYFILHQRGCSGGGSFFRLGLLGVCVVPFLLVVSFVSYILFAICVLRMEKRFPVHDYGTQIAQILDILGSLVGTSDIASLDLRSVCYGLMFSAVIVHMAVLCCCFRVISLLTCCSSHGQFENYHQFDNPSMISLFDDYYSELDQSSMFNDDNTISTFTTGNNDENENHDKLGTRCHITNSENSAPGLQKERNRNQQGIIHTPRSRSSYQSHNGVIHSPNRYSRHSRRTSGAHTHGLKLLSPHSSAGYNSFQSQSPIRNNSRGHYFACSVEPLAQVQPNGNAGVGAKH